MRSSKLHLRLSGQVLAVLAAGLFAATIGSASIQAKPAPPKQATPVPAPAPQPVPAPQPAPTPPADSGIIDTTVCWDEASCTYDAAPDSGVGGTVDTVSAGDGDPGVPDLTPDMPATPPTSPPQPSPSAPTTTDQTPASPPAITTETTPTPPPSVPASPAAPAAPTTTASAPQPAPTTTATTPTATTPAAPAQPTSPSTPTVPQVAATPKPPPICTNLPELTAVPDTMDRNATSGVCTPKCLNRPDLTYLPDRWYKDAQGNCFARGWDNYGMCDQHGHYVLVAYPDVDGNLQDGYGMAIYVDGAGEDHHLNCLITDLATYKVWTPSASCSRGNTCSLAARRTGCSTPPSPIRSIRR